MTTIVAPVDGDLADPAWASDITDAVNALTIGLPYGTVLARGRRNSNSTAASAEQSVLRIDGITIRSGNVYWICTGPLIQNTTVAGDAGAVRLRIDAVGAVATTASAQLQEARTLLTSATASAHNQIGVFYTAVANTTLSVLLTTVRLGGTGNTSLGAAATVPIELFVIDCGIDPGDTGVDL